MPRLADRQHAFGAALLDPSLPLPPGLVGPDGEASATRFAVYSNNVVLGLVATLRESYPAVCRIVGRPFFDAMARVHAVAAPPSSPILLDYGADFPDFIASFGPARVLPYLTDVARIERAWLEAYHAPDASVLGADAVAVAQPEQLPHARLGVHPAVRVVRSAFPAVTIWAMNVDGGVARPVDIEAGGEDAMVVRPVWDVTVIALPPGAATFLDRVGKGCPIVEAVREVPEIDVCFDLSAILTGLLRAGVFSTISLPHRDGVKRGEA